MNVDEIFQKYGKKIEQQMHKDSFVSGDFSREYLQFKREMAPELSRYERWCQSLGSLIKLKVSQKDEGRIQKQLEVAHLDVSPSQVVTLALVSLIVSFFCWLVIKLSYIFYCRSVSNTFYVFIFDG